MESRFIFGPRRSLIFVAVIACAVSPAFALTETCLSGTAPDVANDASQIRTARGVIETTCVCASFDGSTGKTHRDYVRCTRTVIRAQIPGALRKQCARTMRKFYIQSTCGMSPALHAAPCIRTTLKTGRITCTIKPLTKKD